MLISAIYTILWTFFSNNAYGDKSSQLAPFTVLARRVPLARLPDVGRVLIIEFGEV